RRDQIRQIVKRILVLITFGVSDHPFSPSLRAYVGYLPFRPVPPAPASRGAQPWITRDYGDHVRSRRFPALRARCGKCLWFSYHAQPVLGHPWITAIPLSRCGKVTHASRNRLHRKSGATRTA